MIQAGCPIELGDDGGKINGKSPFIRAAAGRETRSAPAIPPRRHKSRQGLDDQHAITAGRTGEQVVQQRVARRVGQFVDGERRQ